MKKTSILIICSLLFSWFMQSCEREMMDYQGKPGIYFAVQHGDSSGDETTWPYQPNTNVEFFKILEDEATINIKVMATGSVSNIDRPFRVEINPDSTNAELGKHYEALSSDFFIPKGEAYTHISLKVKRTADMQEKDIKIGLKLIPNEHFELAFPEFHAVEDLYYGDIVESFDASLHSVIINDVMTQPSRWSGSGSATSAEGGLFGVFSRKKIELMCEVCNLTYADFCDADIMTTLLRYEVRNTMQRYLTLALESGNPILEDDGRLMWVGNCSWKSYVGVPYIPAN